MLYVYKAVRAGGGEYEATMEAADKFALYKEVHAKGDAVISAHEKTAGGKLRGLLSLSVGGVKAADRIMFAKNLSAMLRAGLPLARALAVLERQIGSSEWKRVFASIQDNLAKGVALSASLKKFPRAFGPLFTSMVAAGEESGNLAGSLSIAGDELEKSHELSKKVRGAMVYPLLIMGLMGAIGALMLVYVLPKLTATFKDFNAELPLATRAVIAVSDAFQSHSLAIAIVIAVVAALFIAFERSAFGKRVLHKIVLKLPVIGSMVQEVNSARMARTLSSLLSSGVSMVEALKISEDVVQNVHYKAMLKATEAGVQKGATLQSAFSERQDLYPAFVGEMAGVGEETGTLSKSLMEVAVFYENEIDQKTKDMSTVIEPLLMIAIGIGVGFFALAMISPIYSLSNAI
ncbi:MAG TPA: type II secretion system F family protein [Candidatus Paceibacterota bacterium]|nr:type II secretion system F family protein [Candidatus Paceibacterota bacterium]